jgi:hypothetical protein
MEFRLPVRRQSEPPRLGALAVAGRWLIGLRSLVPGAVVLCAVPSPEKIHEHSQLPRPLASLPVAGASTPVGSGQLVAPPPP